SDSNRSTFHHTSSPNWTTLPMQLNTDEGKELRRRNGSRRSSTRSIPVPRRKDDRPELGIWRIELKGHGEVFRVSVLHPDDPAALLDHVLGVHKTHGLADMNVHFHLQKASVRVDNQC